ncbi:MAG TPA: hypothetical protein VIC08_16585 [Cellvibrionaceae bacterium]
MKTLSTVRQGLSVLFCACFLMMAAMVNAEALTKSQLDSWLATTEDLIPLQSVLDSMGEDSTVAKQYTEEEFEALAIDKQNEVMDEMLKEQGVYDDIYAVLKPNGWSHAGDYMRIGNRLGKAISVHMQNQMLANLPPEQAQMVKEMTGNDIDAAPEDIAFVTEHWETIEGFMGKFMQ